jgi:hypothetical protein
MTLSLYVLIALGIASVAVWGYHKLVERKEDDFLHTNDPGGVIMTKQASVAHSLENIEKAERILIFATIAWGLIVGCIFIYTQWQASSRLP